MDRSPTALPRGIRVPLGLVLCSVFAALLLACQCQPVIAQAGPATKGHRSVAPRKNQVLVQLSVPSVSVALTQEGIRTFRPASSSFSSDHLASSPLASHAAQAVKLEQQRFISECKAAGLSVTVDSTFSTLFNLVSVRVATANEIDALRHIPGVRNIYPVLSGPLPPQSQSTQPHPIPQEEARALLQPHQTLRRRDNTDRNTRRRAGAVENVDFIPVDQYHQTLHNWTRLTTVRELDPSLTGQGIKVGVISSGIDWQHPAFVRDGQVCDKWGDGGCRVTHGWACHVDAKERNENGTLRIQPTDGRLPFPSQDDLDSIKCVSAQETAGDAVNDYCVGMGTTIASVVGGHWKQAVNGVAPAVTFGAYNIRPCTKTDTDFVEGNFEYTTHLFLRIVERAFSDGMDVLVIEPTFRYGFHTQDTMESAMISLLATSYGITTVVPAGELRPEEPFNSPHRIESPAHSSAALAVTSTNSPIHPYDSINVTVASPTGDKPIQRRLQVLAPLNPNAGPIAVSVFEYDRAYRLAASPHQSSVLDDGCPTGNHTWPAGYFAGHVVVVRLGSGCSLAELFTAARDAKAAGVVFYDYRQQLPSHIDADWASLMLPAVMVRSQDGEWLRQEVARAVHISDPRTPSRARLRMNRREWVHSRSNTAVVEYSRWGPSMDLAIKPDVGCIGEHMVVAASSHVVREPSLALERGTRMATGYIAGLAALVKQRFPRMPAAQLMDRVRNAARPVAGLQVGAAVADSVIKQGAGAMIDAHALLASPLHVTPSKLELGDVPGFPFNGKFQVKRSAKVMVRNTGSTAQRVIIKGVFAEGVRWGKETRPNDRYAMAKTIIGPMDVTIAPGEQAEIELTLDLSYVAEYARNMWNRENGGGADPGYGRRPVLPPTDPPAYGKRRAKGGNRLLRRDGEPPAPIAPDEFPTTDLPPNAPPVFFLSGYVSFASANTSDILASVPYLLFAGDYRGGAYFPTDGKGTPYLFSEYRIGPQPRDWTSYLHVHGAHVPVFNLTTRGTTPRIGFSLYQPIRRLHLDLIDANSKAFVGKVAVGKFQPSGFNRDQAFMFPSSAVGAVWEGDLIPPPRGSNLPSRVPNGTYMYRVSLFKFAPLTDPARGDEPIVWTSPPFIVRFNSTSDVFGRRGIPEKAAQPWDRDEREQEPPAGSTDPDPSEPTESPVPPTGPSITPADPAPSASATASEPTPFPTPILDPIGIIIIPGTNSSSSDTSRLTRREPVTRHSSPGATPSPAQALRSRHSLCEWAYTATTRTGSSAEGGLVVPWHNIDLQNGNTGVGSSLPARGGNNDEQLEFNNIPTFLREAMDYYPGQPTSLTVRGGNWPGRQGNNVARKPKKTCVVRKKTVSV